MFKFCRLYCDWIWMILNKIALFYTTEYYIELRLYTARKIEYAVYTENTLKYSFKVLYKPTLRHSSHVRNMPGPFKMFLVTGRDVEPNFALKCAIFIAGDDSKALILMIYELSLPTSRV